MHRRRIFREKKPLIFRRNSLRQNCFLKNPRAPTGNPCASQTMCFYATVALGVFKPLQTVRFYVLAAPGHAQTNCFYESAALGVPKPRVFTRLRPLGVPKPRVFTSLRLLGALKPRIFSRLRASGRC